MANPDPGLPKARMFKVEKLQHIRRSSSGVGAPPPAVPHCRNLRNPGDVPREERLHPPAFICGVAVPTLSTRR